MIIEITSAEQAENALRTHAGKTDLLVFDLSPGLLLRDIPCVIRKCNRGDGGEYIGWNIWGKGFDKKSTFCPECGFAMETIAEASVVIQGNVVLQLSWRNKLKELNLEGVECELKELQQTCRSCKWWTKPEDQMGEEYNVLHPIDPDTFEPMVFPFDVRICKCPRILFGEHPVESCGACVIDGSGYMAKLLTAENFSCSLHEQA